MEQFVSSRVAIWPILVKLYQFNVSCHLMKKFLTVPCLFTKSKAPTKRSIWHHFGVFSKPQHFWCGNHISAVQSKYQKFVMSFLFKIQELLKKKRISQNFFSQDCVRRRNDRNHGVITMVKTAASSLRIKWGEVHWQLELTQTIVCNCFKNGGCLPKIVTSVFWPQIVYMKSSKSHFNSKIRCNLTCKEFPTVYIFR